MGAGLIKLKGSENIVGLLFGSFFKELERTSSEMI
jgi:hypothetical protein